MAKLRIRRGDKVLGSTDEDGLHEWLESGLISEFDLVAVGEESDDWQLIRDFVGSRPAPAVAEPSIPVEEPPPTPSAPAPEEPSASSSDYRPIWEVDDDDEPDEEPVAEIRIPKPSAEPESREPEPERVARSDDSGRRRATRSSGQHRAAPEPAEPSGDSTPVSANGGALDDATIDELFRKLVKWEGEAPRVKDPAAESDPRVAARKSGQRSSESGTHRRGKKRRPAAPSDPDRPRRKPRRRP